uniref:Uncharacterized protein n=1 Tax=Zea mays TaxID=4577 RepID=B4FLF8_MAIZE|nr:unknown [Zea mays]
MVSTVAETSCAISLKELCTLSPKYVCHRELLRRQEEPANQRTSSTASSSWRRQESPLSRALVLGKRKGCSTFGPLSFQRRKTSLPSCRASRSSTTRSWNSTRATPGCEQEEKQEITDLKKRLLIGSLLVIVTPLKSRLCGDYCLLNKKSAI